MVPECPLYGGSTLCNLLVIIDIESICRGLGAWCTFAELSQIVLTVLTASHLKDGPVLALLSELSGKSSMELRMTSTNI